MNSVSSQNNLTYPIDKDFAEALCAKNKNAIKEFQELYCDELYFVASKFNNRGINQSSWNYRTEKGYNINVSDAVANTYVWLVKNIVLNKSCHFRGDNDSSFEGYIKTVLSSDFTFKDWLKWKTDDSLIKIPGATGYVPKAIKKMGQGFIDVYKLLRQKKSDDFICRKLNIELMDYYEIYIKIEKLLISSNQINLIMAPRLVTTDINDGDDDEKPTYQISGEKEIAPEKHPDLELIKVMIQDTMNSLNQGEQKILIMWGSGFSIDEIYQEFLSSAFLNKFKVELKLNKAASIYPLIEKLILKSLKFIENNHNNAFIDYNLNKSKMKKLLKTYFNYFF